MISIAKSRPIWKPPLSLELVQNDLLDVLYVLTHSSLRASAISPPDGGKYLPVTGKRHLQPPLHLQRAFAALSQQIHKHVQDLQDHAVLRCVRDGVMELRILVDGQLASIHLFLLAAQDVFQLIQIYG